MEKKSGIHRVYEPPIARDLSGLAASGVRPFGTCAPIGSYPWVNCQQGLEYGTTSTCNPTGNSPTGLGNGCMPGATPDQSECLFTGSTAHNTCTVGNAA